MPTETVLFLAFILGSFGLFSVAMLGVDLYTSDVRPKHRVPAPGE